jgi:DNA-binding SARP family transcriptional activator
MNATLHLFGPPDLRVENRTVTLHSNKVLALLAYLVLEPGSPHSRQKLATLLWSQTTDSHARHSLRQGLYSLRNALGDLADRCIRLRKHDVVFNRADDFGVDVFEFEALTEQATGEVVALRRAASIYRGSLLEGLEIYDSIAFDDWLYLQRDLFKQKALRVLHRLSNSLMLMLGYEEAFTAAHRMLQIDPFHEQAFHCLMRLSAAIGDHDGVRHFYERCVTLFHDTLGAGPSQETAALYRELTGE